MISFSDTGVAHSNSVHGQSTLPSNPIQSNPIQMVVKIPVKSYGFDLMQMGALMGAHSLI